MTALTREAMVLGLRAGAPAGKTEVGADLRARWRVVHRSPGGWGTRVAIDRSFAAAGVRRHVAYEVGDTPSVVHLVAHDLGVAFLPPTLVAPSDNVRLVPVRGKPPQWEISLAIPSNRPLTAAARAFADAAVKTT